MLGLAMGFFALELGPLGLIEALIILAVIAIRVRRFPERTGAYLLGTSLIPIIIGTSILIRFPACHAGLPLHTQCYAPVTGPVVIFCVIVALVGAGLLALWIRPMLANRA